MANSFSIVLLSLFVATCSPAMDAALEIMKNEHSSNVIAKLLSEAERSTISVMVEMGATDNNNQKQFYYPSQEAASHKIVYYEKNGDQKMKNLHGNIGTKELEIFAIDAEQIFDRGAQTEIRMAEKISSYYRDNMTRYMGERVAVKTVKKSANAQVLKDFFNEIKILKFLGRFKGYYHDHELHYSFNDFILGENLESLLRTDLDDEERESIAVAVILAVHKLHQRKFILHNDLKSGNIKIHNFNNKYSAKLVDFGQACLIVNPQFETLGSSGYRDPRRCSKDRCLSSLQSDYFSLGVIIFEILAQRKNNYQVHIVRKKVDSLAGEWDLETQEDFEEAFPDSFAKDALADVNSLRSQLITLAKLLTGKRHHQIMPDAITQWLYRLDINVIDEHINSMHLSEMVDQSFGLQRKAPRKTSSEESKESKSGFRLPSIKTLPRQNKTLSGSTSNLRTSSGSSSGSGTPRNKASLKTSNGLPSLGTSSSRSVLTTTLPIGAVIGSSSCGSVSDSPKQEVPVITNKDEPKLEPRDAPLANRKETSSSRKKKAKK